MTNDIMKALWSLKNDIEWAYKQGLEGRDPDIHGLGVSWKNLEVAVMQQDADRKAEREK